MNCWRKLTWHSQGQELASFEAGKHPGNIPKQEPLSVPCRNNNRYAAHKQRSELLPPMDWHHTPELCFSPSCKVVLRMVLHHILRVPCPASSSILDRNPDYLLPRLAPNMSNVWIFHSDHRGRCWITTRLPTHPTPTLQWEGVSR